MQYNNLTIRDFLWLLAILVCSGLFSLAISFSIGYIKMSQRVPRKIFIMSIVVQLLLSTGIFIGVMLWYFSDLASDVYFDKSNIFTGAFLAYILSAVPEIFFSIFVLLGRYVNIKLKEFLEVESDTEEVIVPDLHLKSVANEFYTAHHPEEKEQTEKPIEENINKQKSPHKENNNHAKEK